MSNELAHVVEIVSDHMDGILKCFVPEAKITVCVRIPGENDRDFMLTNDDPQLVVDLIHRQIMERITKQAARKPST